MEMCWTWNNLPHTHTNCCNLCHLKRPQSKQKQASSTDDLQYFGMLAVFRLEDTMKQFSPQLWLKAAEVTCLIWQHQSFGTGVCADELAAAAAGRRAQSPFQGAPLPLRGIPTDGAGVLRTEADTALLASTKLHEFAPWRASLQLLTMSTSVKHRFFFIPLKTFMFIFFSLTCTLHLWLQITTLLPFSGEGVASFSLNN